MSSRSPITTACTDRRVDRHLTDSYLMSEAEKATNIVPGNIVPVRIQAQWLCFL